MDTDLIESVRNPSPQHSFIISKNWKRSGTLAATVPDQPDAEIPARIISIDDDRDFLDAQLQALELAGCAVQAFSSGMEAIRHITCEFDRVVVSDIRMLNMDGLSLFKHVHELDCNIRSPPRRFWHVV